jgi:hypothetical protein
MNQPSRTTPTHVIKTAAMDPIRSISDAARALASAHGYNAWRQLEVLVRDPHNPGTKWVIPVFELPRIPLDEDAVEFTDAQIAILTALANGKPMKTDALATVVHEATSLDRRALWDAKGRTGDLDDLRRRGLVLLERRSGYKLTEEGEAVAERFV